MFDGETAEDERKGFDGSARISGQVERAVTQEPLRCRWSRRVGCRRQKNKGVRTALTPATPQAARGPPRISSKIAEIARDFAERRSAEPRSADVVRSSGRSTPRLPLVDPASPVRLPSRTAATHEH